MHQMIGAARFVAVFFYTLCCLFIIACVFPFQKPQARARVVKSWSARLLRWLGVKVIVHGALDDAQLADCGITPDRVGRLIVSNHVSFLDIFTLNSVVPSYFVAKAEIARWPVFGLIARQVGTIFIERGNKRALIGIGENMQQALQQGCSLLVFPEGTTSDGRQLLKLHANLMESAVRTQADVLPMVLQYKVAGEPSTLPAYTGRTGLFECLWRVASTPEVSVDVHVLQARKGVDRHSLCRGVSADMAAALSVPDPMTSQSADK